VNKGANKCNHPIQTPHAQPQQVTIYYSDGIAAVVVIIIVVFIPSFASAYFKIVLRAVE
jgi:Tfp pilus assembly ATPase PilU